jgi:hypothetical protein
MDPQTRREWRLLSRAQREMRVMARLLRGDVMSSKLSSKRFTTGSNNELPGSTQELLREWEDRKLITGYVPLLSEEGRRYFSGLEDVTKPFREGSNEESRQATGCPFCHELLSDANGAPTHQKVTCTLRKEIITEIPEGSR